jgi:hypothetical protein
MTSALSYDHALAYLTRSGLTAVASIGSVGAVNLSYALRNHEPGEALGVAVLFFILMPALALWVAAGPGSRPATQSITQAETRLAMS